QAYLLDRRMREDWEAAGSKDMYKRAHEKVIDTLENYEPPALPDDVRDTIRSIVVESEKEMGVSQEKK
ncbi:MAG: trimethylamine methyltransferase family protein, partial [Desulfobacterales bacterium]|nr:trimethylamine methyltransferase family protein [Desulfobacterales bacterium]